MLVGGHALRGQNLVIVVAHAVWTSFMCLSGHARCYHQWQAAGNYCSICPTRLNNLCCRHCYGKLSIVDAITSGLCVNAICHAIYAILLHQHTHTHSHLLSGGSCSGCLCSPVRSTGFTALALSRTHDCLLVVNKVQGAVTQQHSEATNFRPQQQHRQLYMCALTLPPTTPAAPAAAVLFCLVSC